MIKDAIKEVNRLRMGIDTDTPCCVTTNEWLSILTAYDAEQDEHMRGLAQVEAVEQCRIHAALSHDSLPKFDLEGALGELDPGSIVQQHMARAFRAFVNGPEPMRPEPKFKVGQELVGKPSIFCYRPIKIDRIADARYYFTYEDKWRGTGCAFIEQAEERYQPAPDRPLEVGDKVTVKTEVTFEIEAEAREDGHVVIGPPTTDAPIVVPLHWLTRAEE